MKAWLNSGSFLVFAILGDNRAEGQGRKLLRHGSSTSVITQNGEKHITNQEAVVGEANRRLHYHHGGFHHHQNEAFASDDDENEHGGMLGSVRNGFHQMMHWDRHGRDSSSSSSSSSSSGSSSSSSSSDGPVSPKGSRRHHGSSWMHHNHMSPKGSRSGHHRHSFKGKGPKGKGFHHHHGPKSKDKKSRSSKHHHHHHPPPPPPPETDYNFIKMNFGPPPPPPPSYPPVRPSVDDCLCDIMWDTITCEKWESNLLTLSLEEEYCAESCCILYTEDNDSDEEERVSKLSLSSSLDPVHNVPLDYEVADMETGVSEKEPETDEEQFYNEVTKAEELKKADDDTSKDAVVDDIELNISTKQEIREDVEMEDNVEGDSP